LPTAQAPPRCPSEHHDKCSTQTTIAINTNLPKIITGNIAGLINSKLKCKTNMLTEQAHDENVIIIALTETHLSPSVKDAEIHIPNYIPFRADRRHPRKKGGVITYVRADLASSAEIVLSTSNSFVEVLHIYIKTLNLMIINIYRPPNCPQHLSSDQLKCVRHKIDEYDAPSPNLILLGDLNFPIINWSARTTRGGSASSQSQANLLISLANDLCMEQCIKAPTRGSNILDLLLTNNDELIHSYTVTDTALSDHKLISATTNIIISPTTTPNISNQNVTFKDLNFFSKDTQWDEIKLKLTSIN